MIRYFPPKATAGFAIFCVSTPNLLPWPPASNIAIISFFITLSPRCCFLCNYYNIYYKKCELFLHFCWRFFAKISVFLNFMSFFHKSKLLNLCRVYIVKDLEVLILQQKLIILKYYVFYFSPIFFMFHSFFDIFFIFV